MRVDVLGVRLTDGERRLLEAAAMKQDTTLSAIARRGAVREARAVLTAVVDENGGDP
jgi:uncharacterized protein (DUF1778 family)